MNWSPPCTSGLPGALCPGLGFFICLAPSFPGTRTRGGCFVISEPFNTGGGGEATRILIRGRARGWGGAPQSRFCSRSSCGPLDFRIRAQETAGLQQSNYCQKERLQIKYSIGESLFEVAVISFDGSDSSHTGLLTTTLGCISQKVYLGRDSRKETAQSGTPGDFIDT